MGWLSNLVSFLMGKKGKQKKGKELGSSSSYESFSSMSDFLSGVSDEQLRKRNAQYCSCADSLADAFSLVEYRYEIGDKTVQDGDIRFREMLTLSPNGVQTKAQFQKTLASAFYREGIAIAFIERDQRGEPLAMWPIDATTVRISYADSGDMFLTFPNQSHLRSQGAEITVPLLDCIVLTRKPSADNPFAALDPSISRVIRVIETNYNGFEAAVKQSHLIRYILTKPSIDNSNDAQRREFKKQLMDDEDGLIILNHAETLQPINSTATYAKQPEMADFEDAVYSYFHLTKDMVQSNMTDIQHHYYMQHAVAPLVSQFEEECNRKLFTMRERSFGNRVHAISEPIDHASLDTKKSIANVLISSGVYRPNDIRRILDLPLLPDREGEMIIQSLNFGETQSANADRNISNDNSSDEGKQADQTADTEKTQEATPNE